MGGCLRVGMNVVVLNIQELWDDYVVRLPIEKQDIYYSRDYCKMFEKNNTVAELFVFEDEKGNIILYPYMKTLIEQNVFDEDYYDIETVYGYGGPISSSEETEFLLEFEKAFLKYCKEEHIIAEFVRFHPLLRNQNIFVKNMQVIHNRYTVWLDLTNSIDEIWMNQVSTQNRNTIRKCEKNGLFVEISDEYETFIEIYKQTMQKVNADEFYFFDKNYFQQLQNNKHMLLLCVKKDNDIIAGAIFMAYGDFFHYHLAGSKKEYLKYSPNNLLLWEAIKYAKEHGYKKFHFGGGLTDSIEDNLFRFKSRFSKQISDFYIGKRVHNIKVYETLIRQWEEKNNKKAKLLLQYRE